MQVIFVKRQVLPAHRWIKDTRVLILWYTSIRTYHVIKISQVFSICNIDSTIYIIINIVITVTFISQIYNFITSVKYLFHHTIYWLSLLLLSTSNDDIQPSTVVLN